MPLHVAFWSSGLTLLVLGNQPIGFLSRTPSSTNRSSVDAPDPLPGHCYLLHTLPVFVGMRGVTFVQNVPLPSTHSPYCLFPSVCNLMRRRPIRLPPPA